MNIDLANNSNMIILIVVAGIALLLGLNIYQKQVGKNTAMLLSVLTIIVVCYFGYTLMEDGGHDSNLINNIGEIINNSNQNSEVNVEAVNASNFENESPLSNNSTQLVEQFESNEPTEQEVIVQTEASGVTDKVDNTNVLNSQNLLPEGDTLFSNVNPSNNGGVKNVSLLNAGHHIGINSQGCSLRNANRGLRSEPPNPQTQVSPWLQTTICPDLHRKALE